MRDSIETLSILAPLNRAIYEFRPFEPRSEPRGACPAPGRAFGGSAPAGPLSRSAIIECRRRANTGNAPPHESSRLARTFRRIRPLWPPPPENFFSSRAEAPRRHPPVFPPSSRLPPYAFLRFSAAIPFLPAGFPPPYGRYPHAFQPGSPSSRGRLPPASVASVVMRTLHLKPVPTPYNPISFRVNSLNRKRKA